MNFKDKFSTYLDILKAHETELNDINVFPIADKDTGKNLVKTLDFELPETESIRDFVHKYSELALYNARGSSGNILALYLMGIDNNWDDKSISNTFVNAAKFVWDNMYNPKEGTMLTLMKQVPQENDFASFLNQFIDNCIKSLLEGPNRLPILKEKNTLDSGSLGFIYILCGIYKCLVGVDKTPEIILKSPEENIMNSGDNFRYCVEGLLSSYKKEDIIEVLKKSGNEIVITESLTSEKEKILKFHIHTNNWRMIKNACIMFSHLIDLKVEDMQNNNRVPKDFNREA